MFALTRNKRNPVLSPAAKSASTPIDDRLLVDSCVAGEPQAWSQLYRHCHDSLIKTIRLLIGKSSADLDLVDEIAARVWYALVRNNGELLARFDPLRGCRLTTFLAILAKSEARQYFRGERRRRAREEAASRCAPEHHSDDTWLRLDTEDQFMETLTPAESEYYHTVLIGQNENVVEVKYSNGNSWQLRHRVRTKMLRFLDTEY